mmetsp:Transcript_24125/g.60217  ORF Transcript_24125/g.60217 Transcript_24125/m.60217 type:complete len:574 (-) Transcript_24125:68-1789(-)
MRSFSFLLVALGSACFAGATCGDASGHCARNLSSLDDTSLLQMRPKHVLEVENASSEWVWPGAMRYYLPPCAADAHVACPGSGTLCSGDQCCPRFNGSGTFPCPSASEDFDGCESSSKVVDCLTSNPICRVGDHAQCPGSGMWCASGQCCPGIDGGPSFPCPSAPPGFSGCASPDKVSSCHMLLEADLCTSPSSLMPHQHGWKVIGLGTRRRRGQDYFMPVYSSHTLDEKVLDVQQVAIYIHGLGADADHYYCDAQTLAETLAFDGSTLTIAPWFGDEASVGEATGGTAAGWDSALDPSWLPLWWTGSSWLSGGDSSSGISSFTVLDSLVSHLVNLGYSADRIGIAGFSAGCQFSSRWSVWSKKAVIPRVIVSDCGSYVYLNETRPAPSCSVEENTGVDHSCSSFEVPSPPPDGYNDYKYGLTLEGTKYASWSYFQDFAGNADMVNEQVEAFKGVDIRFMFGSGDWCNCGVDVKALECFFPACHGGTQCCDTYPDSNTSQVLDVHDQAMVQGSNRLQRGLNYVSFLKASNYLPTVQSAIFDGGHNDTAFFEDPTFVQWMFLASRAESYYAVWR